MTPTAERLQRREQQPSRNAACPPASYRKLAPFLVVGCPELLPVQARALKWSRFGQAPAGAADILFRREQVESEQQSDLAFDRRARLRAHSGRGAVRANATFSHGWITSAVSVEANIHRSPPAPPVRRRLHAERPLPRGRAARYGHPWRPLGPPRPQRAVARGRRHVRFTVEVAVHADEDGRSRPRLGP
jgi:hypothetical protein